MRESDSFLKRHALPIGLILMFALTWPIDLSNAGLLPFKVPFLLYLFLGWGFVVAAVLMTWLTLGRTAVGGFLRRYLMWRVNWQWYLAALIPAATAVLGVFLYAALSGMPPDFSNIMADKVRPEFVGRLAFVIPFLLTDFISNGEEIGWRGYALPRVQARTGALAASLLVGFVWGLWHLPKLLNHWDWGYFAVFMVDTIAKSVLLAWIYNGTRGSLLLVTLSHAASNTAGLYLPTASTLSSEGLGAYAIQAALDVLIVAAITALAGAANLSRTEPKQVQA